MGKRTVRETLSSALKYALSPKVIACVAGIWTEGDKYCLPVHTAASVIRASGSRVLVLHFSNPKQSPGLNNEVLSFWELIDALQTPLGEFVIFFNTSLCSTSDDAKQVLDKINAVRSVAPFNGVPAFLKLEILDKNLRPDDEQVCKVLGELPLESCRICIPFIVGNSDSVQRIVRLGCPAIRIWCSDIGRRGGIANEVRLRYILGLTNIPLILEGGIATPQDVQQALVMGFSAVLINSAFRHSTDPVGLASELRSAIDEMRGI